MRIRVRERQMGEVSKIVVGPTLNRRDQEIIPCIGNAFGAKGFSITTTKWKVSKNLQSHDHRLSNDCPGIRPVRLRCHRLMDTAEPWSVP